MDPLTRILFGLVLVAIGFHMVFKTQFYVSMLGLQTWAEKTFGGGGTRLFYKLFGTGAILLGIILTLNLFDRLFGGFFRGLFGF